MGSRMGPASSILELLTYPNPRLQQAPQQSSSNSKNTNFFAPVQVKKWAQFENFRVLEKAFGGQLLQAARQKGRQLPTPLVWAGYDTLIRNEDQMALLAWNWNRGVVMTALDPIKDTFKPLMWVQGDPPSDDEKYNPPRRPKGTRNQPARKCAQEAKSPKLVSLRRMKPDSGSVSICGSRKEKFPKEYKLSLKWRSNWIFERNLVDEDGIWDDDQGDAYYALPVKQAFTYCIRSKSRYGCILTGEEAFIFRVSPLEEQPSEDLTEPNLLANTVANNGLLEYVSIPWDNHCQGDLRMHKSWTVNLALWFLHVLAGCNHGLDWEYKELVQEIVMDTRLVSGDGKHKDDKGDRGLHNCEDRSKGTLPGAPHDTKTTKTGLITRAPSKRKRRNYEEDEHGDSSSSSGESNASTSIKRKKGTAEKGQEEEDDDSGRGQDGYFLSFTE